LKTNGSKTIRVKVEHVTIPVYTLADGRFCVSYRLRGKARKHVHKDRAVAIRKAEDRARAIVNGEAEALSVSDREVFLHAKALAAKHGKPLTVILEEWARLNGNTTDKMQKPISEVVAALMASRSDSGLSVRYMRGLKFDLKKFAERFDGVALRDVTAEEIEEYLRGLNVSARRRNNVRDELVTLARFARERGFLPDRTTEAEKVKRSKLVQEVPTTYTPAEMREILATVQEQWLPWVALGAFTGMRTEEICMDHPTASGEPRRLMWSDFKWSRGVIDVPAVIAKKHQRRIVPIPANLREWLLPWRNADGPVCVDQRYHDESGRLRKLGLWKENALRHSFGSYWQAVHKNMPKLADIMGNSVAIIAKHYHEAKLPSEGRAWFAIRPAAKANVVRFAA
jgi:hypothetical protein